MDDIDACVDVFQLADACSENYAPYKFSRAIAEANLRARIPNATSLVLVNEKRDGVLVAAAASSLYSAEITVCNEFLYADSEGLELLREFKKWANRWGDVQINFQTSFGGKEGEKCGKVLAYLGFKPIGNLYRVM